MAPVRISSILASLDCRKYAGYVGGDVETRHFGSASQGIRSGTQLAIGLMGRIPAVWDELPCFPKLGRVSGWWSDCRPTDPSW